MNLSQNHKILARQLISLAPRPFWSTCISPSWLWGSQSPKLLTLSHQCVTWWHRVRGTLYWGWESGQGFQGWAGLEMEVGVGLARLSLVVSGVKTNLDLNPGRTAYWWWDLGKITSLSELVFPPQWTEKISRLVSAPYGWIWELHKGIFMNCTSGPLMDHLSLSQGSALDIRTSFQRPSDSPPLEISLLSSKSRPGNKELMVHQEIWWKSVGKELKPTVKWGFWIHLTGENELESLN